MRLRALLLFAWLLPSLTMAHQPSDSYLQLDASTASLTGAWDIALRDLEMALGLDANQDRAITWGELRKQREAIERYAGARLEIEAEGRSCALAFNDLLIDEHAGIGYAVLRFATDCPGHATVTVRYALFFDLDPQHRGLVQLRYADATDTAVFSPQRRALQFDPRMPARTSGFLTFVHTGVVHIWLGFDHILFLLCLLLPAVLRREHGRWQPVGRFDVAMWQTIRVVTAFTAAHSITLALAALQIVALPPRLVESAIAASIVFAALNNVFPVVRHHLWTVAFAFGLLHGFGFASVLGDLGLEGTTLATGLLGFNLGVEVGQLCIVAVWLPLSFAVRNLPAYRHAVLRAGSLAIALLGTSWFVQRALY